MIFSPEAGHERNGATGISKEADRQALTEKEVKDSIVASTIDQMIEKCEVESMMCGLAIGHRDVTAQVDPSHPVQSRPSRNMLSDTRQIMMQGGNLQWLDHRVQGLRVDERQSPTTFHLEMKLLEERGSSHNRSRLRVYLQVLHSA